MRRTRTIVVGLGFPLAGTIVALACVPSSTNEPTTPPATVASVAPARAGSVPPIDVAPADAAARDAGAVAPESPTLLAYAGDGTLVVVGTTWLLARAADGTTRKAPVPKRASVNVTATMRGVVVDDGREVTLLATPTLAPLYRGPGRFLYASGAVEIPDRRVVVVQKDARLLELPLPPATPSDAQADSLVQLAGGTRFDLTFSSPGANGMPESKALLYDDQGKVLGRGVPMQTIPATIPLGGASETVGFAVEGRKVVRIDLRTAAVVRQAVVRCGKDLELGNPTPSPKGDVLLLTCGGDAVVLDGVTLAERRRIPRVMPGCDNGNVLGGRILADGRTFLVQGCGGSAKLDVQAGVYRCSDNAGLVGAPYDMVPTGHGPQVLPGRDQLPPCTPNLADAPSSLGTSGRYAVVSNDKITVTHPGGSIVLEEDAASFPAVSPDEKEMAYARGSKIVVRGLPDGAVRAELEPF